MGDKMGDRIRDKQNMGDKMKDKIRETRDKG